MNLSASNPLSYQHLGFDDVRQWLADEAAGEEVHLQFEQLHPKDDKVELDAQYSRIKEFAALMELNNSFQVYPYDNLHETLRLLALADSTLYTENLRSLSNILEQSRSLKKSFINILKDEASVWEDRFNQIETFPEIEKDLLKVVGPDGEVLDGASSTLSSIRRKLRKSAGSVRSRMEELVKRYAGSG